jgi:hypothetical protein
MKDKIIRAVRLILWTWLVSYSIYFFLNNLIIVKDQFASANILFVLFILAMWWFMIFMGVHPLCFSKPRRTFIFLWIFMIFFSNIFLQDNIELKIYISDILNLLWKVVIIWWAIWICNHEKCKDVIDEKKVEIIEV